MQPGFVPLSLVVYHAEKPVGMQVDTHLKIPKADPALADVYGPNVAICPHERVK